MRRAPWALLPAICLLAACSGPSPPDPERRPEPQAAAASPVTGSANAYKEAARDAAAKTQAQAAQQARAADEATQQPHTLP